VIEAHLPCAAAERPIALEDKKFWPTGLEERLQRLELTGALQRTAEGEPVWYAARRRPHMQVDIRSSGDSYTIFEKETGQAIGSVDGIRAFKECHPGAVYLHRARSYLVDRLILKKKDIVVHRTDRKYFTRVRSDKETEIIKVERSKPEGQFVVRQGQLKVTETVTGYEKRSLPGQELMGIFPLELPPQTFETVGFWVEIENALKNHVEQKGLHFMGGIHAIEHAAIGIFPLFALCDRNDIGGICYPHHPQLGKSGIFIYDGYPGGVGLAQRGFEIVFELLEKTFLHVKSCECEEGCPSCIHSPKCGSGNKPLDKQAGLTVLEGLLGHLPMSLLSESRPEEEPEFAPGPETGLQPEKPAPRVLYFDLETQKLAREVGGWGNVHLMRVSVAVVYDSVREKFFDYRENQIDGLIAHLAEADLIVGFNVKRFDYRVLGAYSAADLQQLPTFDILEDIYGRLGFRLGLDHLARETLNRGKTADGLQAVEWFRRGEMQEIIDYCREDVRVARDLFRHGLEKGCLIYRAKPDDKRVRLLVDWRLEDMLAKNNGAQVE
jgi:DEAD/DEAH box helicase domain-containing protein